MPALDSRVGDLTQNVTEAILVQQVTKCLVDCGVLDEEIGVISLYRQQIKLLSHLLQEHKGVEVLTADRSQGRDKDCIIISMVRSNDAGQVRSQCPPMSIHNSFRLDRRLAEGLEANQRCLYPCSIEIDHFRFAENSAKNISTRRILPIDGLERLDTHITTGRP